MQCHQCYASENLKNDIWRGTWKRYVRTQGPKDISLQHLLNPLSLFLEENIENDMSGPRARRTFRSSIFWIIKHWKITGRLWHTCLGAAYENHKGTKRTHIFWYKLSCPGTDTRTCLYQHCYTSTICRNDAPAMPERLASTCISEVVACTNTYGHLSDHPRAIGAVAWAFTW